MTLTTPRRAALAAMAAATLIFTAACTATDTPDTPTDTGETFEMLVGATSSGSSLEVQALQRWATAVGERSDGRLTITILPDGQLGSELETQEAIINGDVQGVSGGVTGVPELDFLAAAYIFRDADHMMSVLRSDVVDPWREAWVEQSGIDIVGVLERLPRTLTSNVRVETPADMVGLDIRVPNTPFQIAIWESVGATPVAIPSQEVYSALETGVVDAQENALDSAYAARVGEVQSYVSLTAHTYMPQFLGVSRAFLDSLPDDLEAILREEMTVAEDWLSGELDTAYADILADLESQGLEIVEPDIDAFRAAMYAVTEQYAADIWGSDVLDRIVGEF